MGTEETGANTNENKMGVMPINKLLINMSLPIMVSMLVQALYNIVDSIFVSRLGDEALAAVSLAFPIQQLMIAVATGTGVGVNAVLSKSLGEKKFERANQTAKTAIVLAFFSFLAFFLFGIFGVNYFFEIQSENPLTLEYGRQYMTIICTASLGVFFQVSTERLLQSTGRTVYNMYTQGIGAIINIILDPILIFGLFGMPRMEMAGAALATVIAQFVAAGLGFYFNIKFNKEISLNMKGFRLEADIVGRIYSVGIPSIIMAAIGSVMTFGLNQILSSFNEIAVAVFGVYFKVQSFIFMPVFGMNNGLVPIIAYNYGARKPDRIVDTMKCGMKYSVSIMIVGFFIFQFFTKYLLMMFNAKNDMMDIGVTAFRIISISFPIAGFCIIMISSLQALGEGFRSMLVSVTRQLFAILPLAFIFGKIGGLSMLWWAFPVAEIVGLILCTIFTKKVHSEKVKPLWEQSES